jgi:carbon storage regulator
MTSPQKRGVVRGSTTRRKNEGSIMLVLSRKNLESIVLGRNDGIHRPIKVTVLGIQGDRVRLGFEADIDVPIHRAEVWDRMQTEVAKEKEDTTIIKQTVPEETAPACSRIEP